MWRLLQCDGRVDVFLAEIGVAAEARVLRDLRRLEEKGYQLRLPHTDSLGDGLFELRTRHAGMIYRNIFMFIDGDIVILDSFIKKTQKTPKHNLDAAKERRE